MPKNKARVRSTARPAKKTEITVDIPMIGKGTYRSDKRKSQKSLSVPVAKGTRRRQVGAKTTSKKHSEVVSGTGVLGEVVLPISTTEPAQMVYAINPGLSAIFPWISEQARGWSRYRIKRLAFRFRTAAATTMPGNITLFGDANVTAPLPSSLTQAVSYEDAVSGPLWDNLSLQIPVKDETLYLRSGHIPDGQDPKTYDSYIFSWLVTGVVQTSEMSNIVGYIEMDYSIELIDRRITTSTPCECLYQQMDDSNVYPMFNLFNSEPIMGVPTFSVYSDEDANTYLGFPAGNWMITITMMNQLSTSTAQLTDYPIMDAQGLYDDVERMANSSRGGVFVTPNYFNTFFVTYQLSVQNSATDYLLSPDGWFLIGEIPQATLGSGSILGASITYLGSITSMATNVEPTPVIIASRRPAHLAYLPKGRRSKPQRGSTSTSYGHCHSSSQPKVTLMEK